MAQLVLTELDDAAEERLKTRARRLGRSLEAEACTILEEAAREESLPPGLSEEARPRGTPVFASSWSIRGRPGSEG